MGGGACQDSLLELTESQTSTIVGNFTPILSNGGNVNSNPFAFRHGSRITDVCSLVDVTNYTDHAALWAITPNPANDFLQVAGLQATAECMIVNILGKVMQSISVSPGEKIDVSQLPPGMYFLRTKTSPVGFASRKFLIVR